MAEMMMRDLISKSRLNDDIIVESRATSNYEIGNPPHPGALSELKKHNILVHEHHSKQITRNDFDTADLIIGMDHQNIDDLKRNAPSADVNKIHLAFESVNKNKVIEDPWYDHKFDRTYRQLAEVLPKWLDRLR